MRGYSDVSFLDDGTQNDVIYCENALIVIALKL